MSPPQPPVAPRVHTKTAAPPTAHAHMPATVTQRPEPQILYEPCVRPSRVRRASSSGRSPVVIRELTNDREEEIFESTPAENPPAAAPTGTTIDDQTTSTTRQLLLRSELPVGVLATSRSRSDSRDSLSTWPSPVAVVRLPPARRRVARLRCKSLPQHRRRRLVARPTSRSVGTNTPTSGSIATMPQLDWPTTASYRVIRMREGSPSRNVFIELLLWVAFYLYGVWVGIMIQPSLSS